MCGTLKEDAANIQALDRAQPTQRVKTGRSALLVACLERLPAFKLFDQQ